jgi:glycosyltransferase involved in cell wall biosynthesis
VKYCRDSADYSIVDCEIYFVIPAYNEADCIAGVISAIFREYPTGRVVVVDDGSADRTGATARAAGAEVIRLPLNSGYGVALQTGLRWVARRGASTVVTLDADGQHDPAESGSLLELIGSGHADLVIGSRYWQGGARYAVPWARRLGSRVFAAILSALIGRHLTDPTSGFQCLNAKALRVLVDLDDFPAKAPDADVLFHLDNMGIRLGEAAVHMYADQGSDSMHGFLKSFTYVPNMLAAMAGVLLARARR